MKTFPALLMATGLVLSQASFAFAQNVVINVPNAKTESAGTTTIYRQVMPDGRIVYSDTITKGVKVDRILSVPNSERKTASMPSASQQMSGAGNAKKTAGSENAGR